MLQSELNRAGCRYAVVRGAANLLEVTMRGGNVGWIVSAILLGTLGQSTFAAVNASATYTQKQLGANSFEYALTLNNTGTTGVSTFWFAWIPNYDFLASAPTSIISPAGWSGATVQDGFLGGYSIEWQTATPLAAGQSLSGFTFDTPDAPGIINGISNFAGYPVRTSYVYSGASQASPGALFTSSLAVPEPCMVMIAFTTIGLMRRRAAVKCS
jgi:hypothetical protein